MVRVVSYLWHLHAASIRDVSAILQLILKVTWVYKTGHSSNSIRTFYKAKQKRVNMIYHFSGNIHFNLNIHSINFKNSYGVFIPIVLYNFYYFILSYFSYINIPCAVTMIVKKTKASEKTAAFMLKTIVSVLVYQNWKIIYN